MNPSLRWSIKILSDVEHFVPDIEIFGGIKFDPDFLKLVILEKLDGFLLTFQIKSNTLKIRSTFQLTYNIDVDTHLIEMKITHNDNQYIDCTVSGNMVSKELKAKLILNQETIFAMNFLLGML